MTNCYFLPKYDMAVDREYYKIYNSGDNRSADFGSLHLGYQAATTELMLKSDQSTYFHYPFFADKLYIQQTTLISDGAVAGPIPAMADRIYKNRGGYGLTTPAGPTTETVDGQWFCSWLYQPESGAPVWMDRFYNPGHISYQEMLAGITDSLVYIKTDPTFSDVASTLTFEPGVQYRYYHQGTKKAKELTNTLSQLSLSALRMNVVFGLSAQDYSSYAQSMIQDNVSWEDQSTGSITMSAWDGEKGSPVTRVLYDDSYNTQNEFTLNTWVKSSDWVNCPSSQIVGNYNQSGYSLFYNNLKDTPFYISSESTYGHVLFSNPANGFYKDQNVQITSGTPSQVVWNGITGNNQAVVSLSSSGSQWLVKMDHLGNTISRSINNLGGNVFIQGVVKLAGIDANQYTTVVTTSSQYVFDENLILQSDNSTLKYSSDYMIYNHNGEVERIKSVKDAAYDDNGILWSIPSKGSSSGILFYGLTRLPSFTDCRSLKIDPESNIWIIQGDGSISKISSLNYQSQFKMDNFLPLNDVSALSFIWFFDSVCNKMVWRALLKSSIDKQIYVFNSDGTLMDSVSLLEGLNAFDLNTQSQDVSIFSFITPGDFTGYEWKRVFNKGKYNNIPQIQAVINVQSTEGLSTPKMVVASTNAAWADGEWYMLTMRLQKSSIFLHIDGIIHDQQSYPPNYKYQLLKKNDMYVGRTNGRNSYLSNEILFPLLSFRGLVGDIRIYDYAIPSSFLVILLREKYVADDITWNINTARMQFIDEVERFFKHKLPGMKSNFFKLRILNSTITDPALKTAIEDVLRSSTSNTKPMQSDLIGIEWVD